MTVLGVPEPSSHGLLKGEGCSVTSFASPPGPPPSGGSGAARLGDDGETRGHGHPRFVISARSPPCSRAGPACPCCRPRSHGSSSSFFLSKPGAADGSAILAKGDRLDGETRRKWIRGVQKMLTEPRHPSPARYPRNDCGKASNLGLRNHGADEPRAEHGLVNVTVPNT